MGWLDVCDNGNISPVEFIHGVSQFSVKGEKDAKLRCKLQPRQREGKGREGFTGCWLAKHLSSGAVLRIT